MKDRFVESWRRSGDSNRSFGVSNPVAFGLHEQKNYMRNEAFRYIAKDRMIYGRWHTDPFMYHRDDTDQDLPYPQKDRKEFNVSLNRLALEPITCKLLILMEPVIRLELTT